MSLKAIGRAMPALTRPVDELLEGIRAGEQLKIQQEDLGMRRQVTESNLETNRLAQQKHRNELEMYKKEQDKRNTKTNISLDYTYKMFAPEVQKDFFDAMVSKGAIDMQGNGTEGDISLAKTDLMKDPIFLKTTLSKQSAVMKKAAENKLVELQEAQSKPDFNEKKVAQLQAEYNKLKEDYETFTKNFDAVTVQRERVGRFNQWFDKFSKSEVFKDLPPNYQSAMTLAAATEEIGTTFELFGKASELKIKMFQAEKSEKVPSSGNATDLAIRRKFGSDYLTDPQKAKEADRWLDTSEGKKAVQDARDDLTSPSITYLGTPEGYTPAITRGKGVGTIGEPSGVKKPLPVEQAGKIGELGVLLNNITETRKLYKPEWVGPVKGRTGKIEEKYLGTAPAEQVKFYSYVRDMQDALLRARSGAQINEQEFKRLVSFLPDPNLPAKSFEARLDRFEEQLINMLESKKKALSEGGYGKENITEESNKPKLLHFEDAENDYYVPPDKIKNFKSKHPKTRLIK